MLGEKIFIAVKFVKAIPTKFAINIYPSFLYSTVCKWVGILVWQMKLFNGIHLHIKSHCYYQNSCFIQSLDSRLHSDYVSVLKNLKERAVTNSGNEYYGSISGIKKHFRF